MAIAIDSASNQLNIATGSSTVSFTNTAGNIVFFLISTNGDDNSNANPITAVSYGGVSMAQLGSAVKVFDGGVGNRTWMSVWYLTAPSVGSNNFSVTSSVSHVNTWNCRGLSYSGTRQTGIPDNSGTNTGTGSPTSAVLTPNSVNSWVALAAVNIDGNYSAGASTTARGTASAVQFFDTNGTASGATTLTATYTGSRTWGAIIFSFAPFVQSNSGFFRASMN